MKIVLATIWNVANYGALLQCYGLCKYLTDSGHDVSLLDLSMSNTNILLKNLSRSQLIDHLRILRKNFLNQ